MLTVLLNFICNVIIKQACKYKNMVLARCVLSQVWPKTQHCYAIFLYNKNHGVPHFSKDASLV